MLVFGRPLSFSHLYIPFYTCSLHVKTFLFNFSPLSSVLPFRDYDDDDDDSDELAQAQLLSPNTNFPSATLPSSYCPFLSKSNVLYVCVESHRPWETFSPFLALFLPRLPVF